MLRDLDYDELENLDGVNELRELVANRRKSFTVAVEGNIGCGKSTLLSYFQECPTVEALKEPVEQWTNLQGHNALKLLYDDPKRWCFSFNNYAMLTRLEMHKYKPQLPVKMLERSLYSTKYIFVENSYKSGLLTDFENDILTQWFDFVLKRQQIEVDLFVYLRAPPEVCYERLKKRNRKEEKGVPFELIKQLHDLHEEWLIRQVHRLVPAPVLVLDASHEYSKMKQVYEENRSNILCGCE